MLTNQIVQQQQESTMIESNTTPTSIKYKLVRPDKWPKSNQRTRFKTNQVGSFDFDLRLILTLSLILSSTVSIRSSNASSFSWPSSPSPSSRFQLVNTTSSTQPSANLPKFGLIKGLKFAVKSSLDNNNKNTNSNDTELRSLFKRRNTVAAFLGIPYAAPPTRSLRFMPPGAVKAQQHQQLAGQLERCQLAQRTVQARPFTDFGHECVRLSDWLDNSAKKQSNDNNYSDDRPLRQDENCLNLNVFVPLDQLNQINTNNEDINGTSSRNSKHKTRFSVELNESQPNKDHLIESINGTKVSYEPSMGQQMKEGHLANQSVGCHLESITAAKPDKLPVLVIFRSSPPPTPTTGNNNKPDKTTGPGANSLEYLQVAHMTNSIVITFNHRIGLLGYLPFADADEHQQQRTSNIRFNHAIWDQLGLLHWLKHNVHHFNGDPANVTLMSGDNQAVQSIQLLALSPLSKGLFKRLFIVRTDNRDANEPKLGLNELVKLGQDSQQSTSKLIGELELIVANQNRPPVRRLFDHLKSSNLSQLASIELELSLNLASKYLALVNQPNLDDKLLFPYFSNLFQSNKPANLSALDELAGLTSRGTSVKSELNYCLYMRQLELKLSSIRPDNAQNITQMLVNFDPVGLIPRIYSNQVNSTGLTNNSSTAQSNSLLTSSEANLLVGQWRQDLNSMPANAIRSRRAAIAADFHHLRHAQLLNSLLIRQFQQQHRHNQQQLEDEEEEQEEAERKQQQRSMQILSSSSSSGAGSSMSNRLKRFTANYDHYSALSGAPQDEAQQRLAELLAPIDLMVGFVGQPVRSPTTRPSLQDRNDNQQYNEIVKALNGLGSGRQLDEDLLELYKFADLHFFASLGTDESLFLASQYCDFQSKQRPQTTTKLIPSASISSTRMFIITDHNKNNVQAKQDDDVVDFSWLLDSSNSVDSLSDFVRFGRQKHEQEDQWPAYNSLNRHVKLLSATVASEDQEELLKKLVEIQMDLVPYLQQSRMNSHTGSSQRPGTIRAEPVELVSCLNDIEFALKSLPVSIQHIARQQPVQGNLSLATLARFNEEAQCLVNVTIHLRNHLRSISSLDLDLMVRRLNLVVASAGQSRQLALIERSSSSSSSRSLVNTTNSKAEDTEDNSDIESTGWQSPRTSPTTTTSSTSSGGSSSGWLSGKNLLARAYKDPVGQALSVIIGVGFFVFLINLLIVLIVLRSAQRNRQRNGRVNDSNESAETLETETIKASEAMLSTICTNSTNLMGDHLMDQQAQHHQREEANQQQPLVSSFKTGQRVRMSSSPSFRQNRCIKFDLTGTNERERVEETTTLASGDQQLVVPTNLFNLNSGGDDDDDDEDDTCSGPELGRLNGTLRVAPSSVQRAPTKLTLNPDELHLQTSYDELSYRQQQQSKGHSVCPRHLQNSLSSPFGSQSTSSSATMRSNQPNHHNHHHHHHNHSQQLNNQLIYIQHQADGINNLHSSIASPSSSATLSTTPVLQPPAMVALTEHPAIPDHLIGFTLYQPLEENPLLADQQQANQLLMDGKMFSIHQEPIYYLQQQERRD